MKYWWTNNIHFQFNSCLWEWSASLFSFDQQQPWANQSHLLSAQSFPDQHKMKQMQKFQKITATPRIVRLAPYVSLPFQQCPQSCAHHYSGVTRSGSQAWNVLTHSFGVPAKIEQEFCHAIKLCSALLTSGDEWLHLNIMLPASLHLYEK